MRVSKKYVIFIEPSYEFGSEVTRNHIYKKGYPIIKENLFNEKNYKIIFRNSVPIKSYINGTEIIIIKKNKISKNKNNNILICPRNKKILKIKKNSLICEEENIFYKIKKGISLLELDDGHEKN